jgi:hypothetical protein
MPAGGAPLGADVTIAVQPTGELGVTPAGRMLTVTGLKPGPRSKGARGSVAVRNQTATRLAVALRALPSSRDLDDSVFVVVRAGGRELFGGALGELRSWTKRSLVLGPGDEAKVKAVAWIPRSPARDPEPDPLVMHAPAAAPPEDSAGRIEEISLQLRTKPAGEST